MLVAGADEGSLDHDDIEYIKNVFKLDKMTAEDVMTPRKSVISISYDASDKEILEIIEEESFSNHNYHRIIRSWYYWSCIRNYEIA